MPTSGDAEPSFPKRVAFAGFLHETNTFAPSKATLSDFTRAGGRPALSRGQQVLERCRGINRGIAGAIDHAEENGWEIVPILWAAAIPSAHVVQSAYEAIATEIVETIATSGKLDGIYLDLHGAMVTEDCDDGEGELLSRLREHIGSDVPVAVSLDLHANLSDRMVELADLLVAFRTYPHVDMAQTGRRAAAGLGRLMDRGRPYEKAVRRPSFLIPLPWQSTLIEPAKSIYENCAALEGGELASISYVMGFPAADIVHCGQSVVAYAETLQAAEKAAEALFQDIMAHEGAFAGRLYTESEAVSEALRIARNAKRPVVIADAQDNPGAGGDSNTTGILRALLEQGASGAAVGLIVDPDAALAAHAAGEGSEITIDLAGTSGVDGDAPLRATYRVERLSDGKAYAGGPFYGGVDLHLGKSACLSVQGVSIVVTTEKAQMADLGMYRFVGIEPSNMAILVNKSSVHFRADFEPIAEAILVCTAPGPMRLNPAELAWSKLPEGTRLSPNGPPFKRAAANSAV